MNNDIAPIAESALLDAMLATTHDGVAFFDRALCFVRISEALAALHGIPVAAHIGRSLWELLPHAAPTIAPLLQQVLDTGEPQTAVALPAALLGPPHAVCYALASYHPVRDAAGAVVGVCLLMQDIHGQTRSEAALQEIATRYHDLFEQANDLVYVLDIRGVLLAINAAGERILGYTRAELLGQPIARIVEPGYLQRMAQMLNRKVEGAPVTSYELEVLGRDGRRLVLEVSSRLVYRDGQPVEIHGIARDISARKQQQEAQRFLAEASQLLTTSLDYEQTLARVAALAVPGIADYCLVDMMEANGQVRRATAVYREAKHEALLAQLARLYPPTPDATYGVPRVFRDGEPLMSNAITDEQLRQAARDEEHLALLRTLAPRSAIMVPILLEGRVGGVITLALTDSGRVYRQADLTLAQDLAERVAQAITNARLYQQAQVAITARDQFFSVAAHELRTPLTALSGYADLLQRRATRFTAFEERDKRMVQTIHSQTKRLQALVNELLDFSRLETGLFTLRFAPLDLGALVQRVAEEMRLLIEPYDGRYTLLVHTPEVPVLVNGDELRLEQVLFNLLQNAVKYSLYGGQITLRLEVCSDAVQLSVSDQGMGIPASSLPHLFQRFYRAENVQAGQISGMGIGLFVVNEIVERHAGNIGVESVEGQGSTFSVRLPLNTSGE